MITTTGKTHLARLLAGDSTSPIIYIGLGFGTAGESVSDTTLQNEQFRSIATYSMGISSVTYSLTVPAGYCTGDITEIGLFSASIGGIMYDRKVFAAITKTSGDTLLISWVETIG